MEPAAPAAAFADAARAVDLVRCVEVLLFEAPAAVPGADLARTAARALGGDVTPAEVDAAVERLRGRLAASGSALDVFAWADGYRLATRAEVRPWLDAARAAEARPTRLSPSVLETLAVIAYRQPVSKPEVDHVRGVESDYALRKLAEHGLVEVVGRGGGVGRPLLYGTTPLFLDTFGLPSLADLPTLREVEELLADPAFSRERARLVALKEPPADAVPEPPSTP